MSGVAARVKQASPPLDEWRSFVYCEHMTGDTPDENVALTVTARTPLLHSLWELWRFLGMAQAAMFVSLVKFIDMLPPPGT